MICLPSIANHQGVCLHCCPIPNETLTNLFRRANGVVTLSNEAEMEAAMVTTCMMGPTYGIMREGRDWLLQNTNLSAKDASYLIIQHFIWIGFTVMFRILDHPNKVLNDEIRCILGR
jgi:hypothetical protein